MKELENNLLGKITYQIALLSFLEGVKVSEEADNNLETLEEKFQKIWFKVQILSVNKINDETLFKASDEILKLYFG